MEHQPKTEPGFGSTDHRNLEDMNIQELVSVLRIAFLTEQFDAVEEVLVSRYNRLQTEILQLQEKFELEKLTRFQAEEDLRKREELCERHKNNYETLLKEVKKNTNLTERDNIGELRKKKWMDDSNALSEPPMKRSKDALCERHKNNYETLLKEVKKTSLVDRNIIGELRKKNNELELEVCELRKLKKRWMDDINAFSELPNKRSKDAQGASSSARHALIVEEPQQNANVHMSEEVVMMGSVVVPPSDVQEQMAINFISLVHQERYSNFLANKKFVEEKNFRLEGENFSDIQAMIVARGWVELTSFAKEASTTLAKEFYANAYQGPAKEDGTNKNDLKQFTSFVRGKMVPFHDKIINELFQLENYEQCSFEARKAKGSIIDHQEIRSTLCRPGADWVRKKDGTPSRLRTSDLTPNAKSWAIFVLHTLLPCSNTSDLPIQKASLVTAILKGERVNVGRLLADDLCGTANCSNPSSYISHASLISKLCERVEVYPEKNEEMVKPSGAITAKWIEKYCTGDIVKN